MEFGEIYALRSGEKQVEGGEKQCRQVRFQSAIRQQKNRKDACAQSQSLKEQQGFCMGEEPKNRGDEIENCAEVIAEQMDAANREEGRTPLTDEPRRLSEDAEVVSHERIAVVLCKRQPCHRKNVQYEHRDEDRPDDSYSPYSVRFSRLRFHAAILPHLLVRILKSHDCRIDVMRCFRR